MIDNSKEYILCAAILRETPLACKPYHEGTNDITCIEIGYRHHDIYQRFHIKDKGEGLDCSKRVLSLKNNSQGFFTSKGRFVDRFEGMKIALECGQVSKERALLSYNDTSELDDMFIGEPLSDPKDDLPSELSKIYAPLFSEDLY